MFFDGNFSHAIHKGPLLQRGARVEVNGLFAPERIEARAPSEVELELGKRVIAAIPFSTPLYARVDMVDPGHDPHQSTEPMLLELEVAEPSCFLDTDPGAAARFARAIERQLA